MPLYNPPAAPAEPTPPPAPKSGEENSGAPEADVIDATTDETTPIKKT